MRSLAAVERLRVPDPEETLAPILEAIGIVRRELAPEQAVVGFCGGPFTVAGYLVEGKPSRDFAVDEDAHVRASPRSGTRCSTSSPTRSRRTRVAQARAGADVVQLFDSWVGALSPADYDEFVAPYVGADPRRAARRRRADDPLRHRHRDAARRRWPRPAAT